MVQHVCRDFSGFSSSTPTGMTQYCEFEPFSLRLGSVRPFRPALVDHRVGKQGSCKKENKNKKKKEHEPMKGICREGSHFVLAKPDGSVLSPHATIWWDLVSSSVTALDRTCSKSHCCCRGSKSGSKTQGSNSHCLTLSVQTSRVTMEENNNFHFLFSYSSPITSSTPTPRLRGLHTGGIC